MIAIDYRVNIRDEKVYCKYFVSIWIIFHAIYLTYIYYNLEMIGYFFYFQVITCAFTLNIWYPKGVCVIAFYVRKQKDLEALNVCVISQYTALRHHINFSVNSKDKRLVEV